MALPSREIALTKPKAGATHSFPEAVAARDGFFLVFTETVPTAQFPFLPTTDTYVQSFGASGKPGAKTMLWKGGGQSPEIVDLGGGKLLVVAPKTVNGDMTPLAAAIVDAKSGKVLKTKELGIKKSDHVYELASLGNGKAALVATSSDIKSFTDKTQVFILDSKLGVKKGAVLQDYPLNWSQTKDYWQVLDRGSKGATAVWLDRKEFMIYAQLLDNNGKASGKKLTINPDKLAQPSFFDGVNHSVKAAATADGGFIVSWAGSVTGKSDGYDTWFRIYDAGGKAKTKATLVNQTTKDTQYKPDVTLLDKGKFALTWIENSVSKGAETHFIRFFDGAGKALSGEIETSRGPWSLSSLDTEWVRLKDGSLAEIYAKDGAIKAAGVPKPVFGSAKAETFGTSKNDLVMAGGGKDKLFGGLGNDILIGGAGDDRISGGKGNDVLTGDAGADRFIFDAALSAKTNIDRITDFDGKTDTIALDADVFATLGAPGALKATLFKDIGATGAVTDADDRILYDSRNGELAYDKDGSGSVKAVVFAKLDNRAMLAADDFIVV